MATRGEVLFEKKTSSGAVTSKRVVSDTALWETAAKRPAAWRLRRAGRTRHLCTTRGAPDAIIGDRSFVGFFHEEKEKKKNCKDYIFRSSARVKLWTTRRSKSMIDKGDETTCYHGHSFLEASQGTWWGNLKIFNIQMRCDKIFNIEIKSRLISFVALLFPSRQDKWYEQKTHSQAKSSLLQVNPAWYSPHAW